MSPFPVFVGPIMLPIATGSELKAAVWSEAGKVFVSIAGPCGQGHTMSIAEASLLRDWLTTNLHLTSHQAKPEPGRWPKMGDIVIYCGAGFTPAPAIVTDVSDTVSMYVFGTGGMWPIREVERGDWRFLDR